MGNKVTGVIEFKRNGIAFVRATPNDIFIPKGNSGNSLPNDTVEVKVFDPTATKPKGVVTGVIERGRTQFVGTVKLRNKPYIFVPDDKNMPFFNLDKNGVNVNKTDKVLVDLVKWNKGGKPHCTLNSVLGTSGEHGVEIDSIINEFNLPLSFPSNVEEEAAKISTEIKLGSGRVDMRDTLTFTIDPTTAKDFDDALSVEWVDGNLKLGVHIADVTHYVKPMTKLDDEALKRGTSIYLVDRVVPMLPEVLSNGLCSLRPHEDKYAFSAIFTMTHQGKIINEWFGRTLINSDHRFSYEEAQKVLEGEDIGVSEELITAVTGINKVAKKLRKKRMTNGAIDIYQKEAHFILDDKKEPIAIGTKVIADSNRLIEEFMLLANKRVASKLKSSGVSINRAHKSPDFDKITQLKEYVELLGYKFPMTHSDDEELKSNLNKLLVECKGTPEENAIHLLVTRTMQKAYYTTENIGHYGLGFDDYSHFTSPIRRYPDMICHRLLAAVIANETKLSEKVKVETKCAHLSVRERVAQKVSRESVKYMQCIFMRKHIGVEFSGTIVGFNEYSMFVEIPDHFSQGSISKADLPRGFNYNSKTQKFENSITNQTMSLADTITVKVKSIDLQSRNIFLTLG